jgi:pimeloyl-ACP methyl ester carboxylesterase
MTSTTAVTSKMDSSRLWFKAGGSGSPTLVLIHGLGANASVWDRLLPIVNSDWPGRWIAPDLRGHGASFHRDPYSFGVHAADIANLLAQKEEVVCLAHSMGGAVAMALASGWFGVAVRHVVAFGVKLEWQAEEIAKMRELGHAPVRWFDTREAALERYLKVSGLSGLIDSAAECVQRGIVEHEAKFRLAMDPRAYLVTGPALQRLVEAMAAPLRLACGAKDPMVTAEQMRRYDPDAVVLDGLGHNPHVEAPERLWELVKPLADKYRLSKAQARS